MRRSWPALVLLAALSACATVAPETPATPAAVAGAKFGDSFGPRPGGGGLSTVTTGTPLKGDGSSGNPVTIDPAQLSAGLAITAGVLTNTAPFGPNVNVDILNGSSVAVHALNMTTSLTTVTSGAEVSKLDFTLLNAGSPVLALSLRPNQIIGPNGAIGAAAYTFALSPTSGMWWDNANQRLAFSIGAAPSGGVPNMYITASGMTLEFATPAIFFHGDGANSIGRTGGGTIAITSSTGVAVNISATPVITVSTNLNVALGKSAVATTATAGFPCVPAGAGPPTGAVTPPTGFAATYVDGTNHKLYHNDGSGWIVAD